MKRGEGEESVLARLIADERSLPAPERDWSRIEAGIFARLAEPVGQSARRAAAADTTVGQSARRAPRSQRALLYLGFAAAAGVALLAASFYPTEQPRRAGAGTQPPTISAGSSRKTSAVPPQITRGAGAGAGHTEHAGRAHWTLEPGSSARVRRAGAAIVIDLDSGSIDAEVEPGQAAESFVVEAGDVRVAVHGTQFRVERRGEMVDVSVWEGVVSVSSKAEPQGLNVSAPGSRRFVEGKIMPAPAAQLPAARGRRSTSPEEPSISEVEAGVSRVQAAAQACFARHTSAKDGVQVSVRSSVALSVRPDGNVVARGFDPPLHPSVDACTRAELGKIRFATSQRGIELSRVLELGR